MNQSVIPSVKVVASMYCARSVNVLGLWRHRRLDQESRRHRELDPVVVRNNVMESVAICCPYQVRKTSIFASSCHNAQIITDYRMTIEYATLVRSASNLDVWLPIFAYLSVFALT